MSSQAPEFAFTRSGESGIIPRAPLPGLALHTGSLATPNVLQRFTLEETTSGINDRYPLNGEKHGLTDAELDAYAETLPPEQAIEKVLDLIVDQVKKHPFIAGGLGEEVTNTAEHARAWGGEGKFEGGTFREGLGLILSRLSPNTPTYEAARSNKLDEEGIGINNSWQLRKRHTDDYQYLMEGVFGPKEAERIFRAAARKPAIRLAGELTITLGADGSLYENLGSFITNEKLTKYTYSSAHRTFKRFSDPDDVFFEEHSDVDAIHVKNMIDAAVEELTYNSSDPVRDLKTILRAMRMTWTVGMKPWLSEVFADGLPKPQGGIDLSSTLRRPLQEVASPAIALPSTAL